MPNFKAGWFKLKGGQKAMLFVSDAAHALYIPTSEDYALVVSPSQPDAFLSALRAQ